MRDIIEALITALITLAVGFTILVLGLAIVSVLSD